MEIVGLLVIVILITLILFFSLLFLGNDNEDVLAQVADFNIAQYIDNMVPTVLYTSSECAEGLVIQDTVQRCISSSITCSNGDLPCDVAKDEIEAVLTSSSLSEQYAYYFSIENPTDSSVVNNLNLSDDCSPENANRQSIWPFQNSGNRYEAKLYVCLN